VPKVASVRWWQRLWQSTGSPRAPWNAAFATVLVAVLVTVLWVYEPIPDARPIAPSASPPMPPVEAPDRAPNDAPKDAPKVVPKEVPKEVPPAAAPARKLTPAPAPTLPAPPVVLPEESPVALQDQGAQTFKRSEANRTLADLQTRRDVAGASQRSSARSSAAALADNMAPAKAAAELSGPEAWDTLLVLAGGRTVTLDRARGRKLFAVLRRLESGLSSPQDAAQPEPAAVPDLQIHVRAQEQVTATFTLWGLRVRWQRPSQAARSGTLDESQVQPLVQLVRDALAADASPSNPP
jgi:hypothetical protein